MLLYFDEYGVLKEQLTYGEPGRVGDTEMQIFAYFDGVDVRDVYNAAFIRFQKPDINGSEYPALFLKLVNLTFDPSVHSNYFSANGGPNSDGTYPCYLFDFSEITDTEGIVKLLDTPGLWRATLTLTSSSSYTANVTGTFTFNVESSAVSTDDETVITYDVIASNIANMVAVSKLNVNSDKYIRAYENFVVDAANGDLPASFFSRGVLVYDKTTNTIYEIDTVTENEEDANYVYATYITIFNVNNYATKSQVNSLEAQVAQNTHDIENIVVGTTSSLEIATGTSYSDNKARFTNKNITNIYPASWNYGIYEVTFEISANFQPKTMFSYNGEAINQDIMAYHRLNDEMYLLHVGIYPRTDYIEIGCYKISQTLSGTNIVNQKQFLDAVTYSIRQLVSFGESYN